MRAFYVFLTMLAVAWVVCLKRLGVWPWQRADPNLFVFTIIVTVNRARHAAKWAVAPDVFHTLSSEDRQLIYESVSAILDDYEDIPTATARHEREARS